MNQLEKQERELHNIVFILCVVWFITAILCGNLINDNSRLKEENQDRHAKVEELLIQDSLKTDIIGNTATQNLILRKYITGKQEKKLLKDSLYLITL